MTSERKEQTPTKHGFVHGNTHLVAYIRPTDQKSIEDQRSEIAAYCQSNGYKLVAEFVEQHVPGPAFQAALNHLQDADGIIATDLNRFVVHLDNRARDLRPLLHHFLTHRSRHLLVIEEGIDTASAAGQQVALETINQLKDADEDFHSSWFQAGHHS